LLVAVILGSLPLQAVATPQQNPLLKGAYRVDEEGWIYVHLEGSPRQIGYQNGWLLHDNIDAAMKASMWFYWSSDVENEATFGDQWYIARDISRLYIWPKLTGDLKAEFEGITAGVKARGLTYDKWDILAFNAWGDIGVYWDLYMSKNHARVVGKGPVNPPASKYSCSAFIATGSYTKDGEIIMAHNTWTDYGPGEKTNVIVDINPTKGHRIIMQSTGGSVWSGPDWLYNDAGLMVTETTEPGMGNVYDPTGLPVFMRERLAVQFGSSIDDFVNTMMYRNSGAYSNEWLVGDAKTGEIASLQLGCYKYDLYRTFDDMIVSCNYPKGPNILDECTFDWTNTNTVPYWRFTRWNEIKADYAGKGLIDLTLAEQFESDHFDEEAGVTSASIRSLCGHGEVYVTGPVTNWDGSELEVPYAVGAIDGKVTSSSLVLDHMGMIGIMGHSCGEIFDADAFLAANPQFEWQRGYLQDMPDNGGLPVDWTEFPL